MSSPLSSANLRAASENPGIGLRAQPANPPGMSDSDPTNRRGLSLLDKAVLEMIRRSSR